MQGRKVRRSYCWIAMCWFQHYEHRPTRTARKQSWSICSLGCTMFAFATSIHPAWERASVRDTSLCRPYVWSAPTSHLHFDSSVLDLIAQCAQVTHMLGAIGLWDLVHLAIGCILTKWESCVIWECAIHNNIIHMRVRRSNSMYDQLNGLSELC